MWRRARKLVHLDLKSANILLQDRNFSVAKIADLGLSKYLGECSMLDHTMRVRPPDLPSCPLRCAVELCLKGGGGGGGGGNLLDAGHRFV